MDELEFDSDRNEDPGREAQLDQSYDEWYRAMKKQIREAEEMTKVPWSENVYAADEELED
ncbi:hypothetical protein COLU111180_00090 [Cohnella lubricantis]|uniref:hypothetical protein n=1 Tax=Cohnella lubricantis TaxID=2163172 RepID=UPI001FD93C56|nr:hypothetical protein [Cohnella lubricantis]MBP2118988.1 hypothetical protein [Cohnella lubricantis]